MYDDLLTLATTPPENPAAAEDMLRYDQYLITPIDHDYPGKTPAMWNAAHRAFDINACMAMMVGNPADTKKILNRFRADHKYIGGGAGVGFKEAVIPYLDDVTPLARAMGAVNIIKKDSAGRLVGDNTDGEGYARSLEQMLAEGRVPLKGARVLMLGAGGSGRAIAFALANRGARLTILNRTEHKAVELANHLNQHFGSPVALGGGREMIPDVLPRQDAVVSVIDDPRSPLDEYSTLGEMRLPITPESRRANQREAKELLLAAKRTLIVSDIRIREREVVMLAQAKALGFKVLNGIPMVVNQGVAAFSWLYHDPLERQGASAQDVADIMWKVVDLG